MREISIEELKQIIEKHEQWLNNKKDGERANLSCINLHGVDLRGVDLQNAILCGANLQCTNLKGAYLRFADLADANLSGADLSEADLRFANLRFANLQCADLNDTNLQGTKLSHANLKGVKREWLVYAGPIGSRKAETIYFADDDTILCGCWNNYNGGTLSEFKARIDKAYPDDIATNKYRIEYLSAINMFTGIRQLYLDSEK